MQILSDEMKHSGALHQHSWLLLARIQGGLALSSGSQRGVKLIGATAHYVTSDLDKGPIIDQDVGASAIAIRLMIWSARSGISNVACWRARFVIISTIA